MEVVTLLLSFLVVSVVADCPPDCCDPPWCFEGKHAQVTWGKLRDCFSLFSYDMIIKINFAFCIEINLSVCFC